MAAANQSTAKNVLRLNPEGKRPRGRPKKRWMDRIKEDMKHDNGSLGRKKWRATCRKVDLALPWEKNAMRESQPILMTE